MTLGELLERLPTADLSGDKGLKVTSVTHDSRRVQPGSVFVAIRGLVTDGNDFVDAACRKGAVAVVSEGPPRTPVAWVRVKDAREALAVLSAAVWSDPSERLELIGVTGTNGKTTTAYLIDAALRAAGHKVGLVGTVQYRIGDRVEESVRTTPESSDLQALFRQMVDEGCRHAVLEVSSHSLALKRVHGCSFKVAVFTNLTRDHLDFHGDMDGYLAAKRILFDTLLERGGHAVINASDARGKELAAVSRGRVLTFALQPPADLVGEDIVLSLDGTDFWVRTPWGRFLVSTPLLGRFNVENILGALGASVSLGIPPETALAGIMSLRGVPGRLERLAAGQPFAVIVDYAHTDDALRKLLETVRELKPRRIISVFGCGGDRDRTKRPLMGAVASRLSDIVVITSDNPRSEPPESIIQEILKGMNGGKAGSRHVLPDRREAISRALELAGPEDAVVIAGKGHETYQVLRDKTIPFDDRQVVRELLAGAAVRGGKA